MSSDWETKRLGEFIELKRGYDLPKAKRKPGKTPLVSSSGVSDTHDEPMVKGPGVVTGRYGTIGEVFYVRKDFWPLNTTLYVRDFKGNHPEFVHYFLKTLDFHAYSDKAAVPGVNRNHLHEALVRTPPVDEQKKIALFLGALDDRITLLRETNKTLESIAQAIFKSWFVDFDPVRAKMEGRQPEGMNEDTAALFPDSFEEWELGLVPRGWQMQHLSKAYEVNPLRKLRKGDEAAYLDMANVPSSGFSAERVTTRSFASGSKFIQHDTLLARITPCLENGKTGFVDFLENGEVGWGSTEFIVLRPKPPLPAFHAYLLCRMRNFREYAIQSMAGTSGRQRIRNDMLGLFPLAVPTPAIAAKFSEICLYIQENSSANTALSKTLAALRDTLLPRLISGQLRLPEAQEQVEAALP